MQLLNRVINRMDREPYNGVRSCSRILRLQIVAFLLICLSTHLLGQIRVSPVILMVTAPNRTVAVNVQNPSATNEREMWVEFKYGYEKYNDKGERRVIIAPSDSGVERSAVRWLRAYPQRFVLPPAGSQVIRIMAAPPPGLPDGEYLARVFISSQPVGPIRRSKQAQGTGVNSAFRLVQSADVPYHYRRGHINTGLIIRDVNTTSMKDSVRIAIDLQRNGNASYWGTLTCQLKGQYGKIVSIYKKNFVMYLDGTYVCFLKTRDVAPGTYTLDIDFASDTGGSIREYAVKTDQVNYSKSISFP
jgi:hypothetical protein